MAVHQRFTRHVWTYRYFFNTGQLRYQMKLSMQIVNLTYVCFCFRCFRKVIGFVQIVPANIVNQRLKILFMCATFVKRNVILLLLKWCFRLSIVYNNWMKDKFLMLQIMKRAPRKLISHLIPVIPTCPSVDTLVMRYLMFFMIF